MKRVMVDQVVASLVQEGINQKELQQLERLIEIQQIATERMQYAQTALDESLKCVENVRDFVSDPEHILGSMQTKHGEIAEHIEVEIRNGRDILKFLKPSATFEGVGRTAPEDYIIDGVQVQSKFINGANNSLKEVLGHLRTYPNFTENGYYHIPKDQYEIISRIANGENIEGFHSRTIRACKETIEQIEKETGKSFSEVVRPGISTYKEVQLGSVNKTLDGYEQEFKDTSADTVKEIKQESDSQKAEAQHITDPSWGEALKYSAVAAVISGSVSAGLKIYTKIHCGKKITEFTLADWKEIGYDFTKGGAKGGISGLGIYGLTKLGGFSAPFAGAMVSTAMGIASLAADYRKGKISKLDFSESACALSVEAGLSSIGAAIGQVAIPIPVLGAIIGTATAKASLEISKYIFGKKEVDLIKQMQQEYDALVKKLNAESLAIIQQMDDYYRRLDGYIDAALSKESAARFYGSIELCRILNVPENCIIHNLQELDDFMLL